MASPPCGCRPHTRAWPAQTTLAMACTTPMTWESSTRRAPCAPSMARGRSTWPPSTRFTRRACRPWPTWFSTTAWAPTERSAYARPRLPRTTASSPSRRRATSRLGRASTFPGAATSTLPSSGTGPAFTAWTTTRQRMRTPSTFLTASTGASRWTTVTTATTTTSWAATWTRCTSPSTTSCCAGASGTSRPVTSMALGWTRSSTWTASSFSAGCRRCARSLARSSSQWGSTGLRMWVSLRPTLALSAR